MNYSEPLQRTDGRWDWTTNRRPAGYCCEAPTLESFEKLGIHVSDDKKEKLVKFADKHHTDGHATAEEACACHKEYLLDNRLRLTGFTENQQERCQICKAWTQKYAQLGGYSMFFLCDEHLNRESVSQLYGNVSWSAES